MIATSKIGLSDSFYLFKSNFMGEFGHPKLDQRTVYYAIACFAASLLPLVIYLPVWMIFFSDRYSYLSKKYATPP